MDMFASFPESTVFTVSLMAFLFLTTSLVGFLHPVTTFGRLIAPYLLCTGIWMVIAMGLAYLNTLLWIIK